MKRKTSFLTSLILLVLIWSLPAQGSEQQKQKARKILDTADVRGGLIVHIGCGDGGLTAELRVNDRYIV